MSTPISNRYDFVLLFDVEYGNPNGDPDSNNQPRIDTATQHGFVTPACIKRKIRNYIEETREDVPGYRIYIKKGVPLNRSDAEAYLALDVDDKRIKARKKEDPNIDRDICKWMCANFYDIRTFGSVMTTFTKAALNCGHVKGPVQITYARSVDPIELQRVAFTRGAITTEEDAQNKINEMGTAFVVPYGLYRAEGFISANLAKKVTGFSEEDLTLLWEAIMNMFEIDHASARGKMTTRDLIIFRHDSIFGQVRASELFKLVSVSRNGNDVLPARSYDDYTVTIDTSKLPQGVTCKHIY